MYSTGDSSGDGLSGLNQFTNMSGQIDWAAMAQQWIQMHDTGNFLSVPDAPPPPNISTTFHELKVPNSNSPTRTTPATIKKSFDEKGEADMEMDEEEENARRGDTPPPPAPSMQLGKTREQTIMQSQAPWYMQQQNQVTGQPVVENLTGIGISDIDSNTSQVTPIAPQWSATVWPPRMNLPPPITGAILNVPLNGPIPNPTAHIPSLLKMNVPNPNTVRMMTPNIDEQNTAATVVDAKKRKMLPAWIREGLEKMEREKQKQLEKEQSKKREEPGCSEATNYIGPVGNVDDATHTVNMKYKQSAENDISGNEEEGETEDLDGVAIGDEILTLPQKIAKDDDCSGISGNEYETDTENNADQRSYIGKRSYEDRLSDLMIVVRTTLTELLLDVTNREIANLAQEAVNAHKAKASSAQVIRKSALSSITGKLGLAAYDDSTGDESNDSENEEMADNDPNDDSEEEIKASIRVKRRAFAKITDEIEERIAANASREEQKLKYYTLLEKQEQEEEQNKDVASGESGRSDENIGAMRSSSSMPSTVSKSYERDFGETTETKLQHSNGKRQKDRNSRKERTTRFSDNKDSKGAAAVAATYISKMHSANANPSGSALFPIAPTATTSSTTLAGTTVTSSSTIIAAPLESSHIAYNIANAAFIDDSSSVSVLNKNLLNAAEAAFEKATKSHRTNRSRSSASHSERERSRRSNRYDHRDNESDRCKERERERERERKHGRERERERDRGKERHQSSQRRNYKNSHSSDEDDAADDDKVESQSSSSDSDTSSSSSTSTSSTSQHSSHYSRTSTTSKHRRDHEYDRRERRDDHGAHGRKNDRSRSRSRQRSHHHHHQRSTSRRQSSAEDDYDNGSRHRHSTSRRDSSRKRSRSRSRSTYSSSSHWRRH